MGLLGLPDLPVDAPLAQDAEYGGKDQEDEDPEGRGHSDHALDLISGHATTVLPDTADREWQDCRTPSNYCHR
ncbi:MULTISPECIES: hypothetical protein [unclassified Streptomyces]|uniref:hypothetical protein n=1 Tax=unclassified Streptomyces TaxID=2593676 RepID=UPI0015EBB24E